MEKAFIKIFGEYLQLFIKDFSQDSLNVSLAKGTVTLTNTQLNEKVIHELLKLPPNLQVVSAFCDHFVISTPNITKIKTVPTVLMIDTIHVSIMEPDVIPPKTRIIKEWRAKQAKESDPKSTMKLLNGLRIEVKFLHGMVQIDKQIVRFDLESLIAEPTNANFDSNVPLNATSTEDKTRMIGTMFKKLTVQSCSVTLISTEAEIPFLKNQPLQINFTMRRNARTNKWLDAQVHFHLGSLSFDWSVTQWKVIRRTLNRVRKGALRVPKAERKEGRLQPTDAIGLNATVSISSLQVGINALDPNDDQRLRLILMGFEANLQKRPSETRPGFKKQVVNVRLDSCTLEQPKLQQVLFSQKMAQGLLDFNFDMNYRKLPDSKHEFEDMLFNFTFNGSRVFLNLERWDHIQEKLKENFEKVKDKAKEKAKEKKAAMAESDKPLGVIGGILQEVQDLLKENAVLLLESKEKRHEFVEELKQRLRDKKAGSSKADFLRKLKYQIIFSDNEFAIQPKDHEHQLVFSLNKMFLLNDVTWKQSIPLLDDARRELIEERAFQESPLPVARAEEEGPAPALPHRGSKPPPPVPDKPGASGPPPRPARPDAPASAAGAPPPRPAKPGQPANPLAIDAAGPAPALPARVFPHNLQVVVHGFGIALVGEDNSSSALLSPLDFELYARYRGHDTESASLELAWHSEKFEASINHYHTAERTFEHVKKWLKHRQEKIKAKVAGEPGTDAEAPATGEKVAEKVSAAKNKLDDLLGKVDLKTDDLKAAKSQIQPGELAHKLQDHVSDFLKHHRGCVLIQFEQVIFNIAEDKDKPAVNPLDTKQGRPHKQVLNRVSLLASSTAEQQDAVFSFAVSDMEFVNHPTFPLYVSAVPLNTALYGLPLSPNIVVHYKHTPQTAPLLLFQFSGIKVTALARVAPGQDTLAKISAPEIVHFLKNFKEILSTKASGYKEKFESLKGKFEELKDKASSLKSRVSETVSSVTGIDPEQAASGGLTEENVSRVLDAAERFFKTAYPYLPQIQFDTGDCHFEFQFEVPHFGTETKPISLRFVDPKRGAINRRMINVTEMENRLRQTEKEKAEMQQTMTLLETQLITHQKLVFDLQSENEQLKQALDQLQRRLK